VFLYSAAQKTSELHVKVHAHHSHGEQECIATQHIVLEQLVSGASKGPGEGTSPASKMSRHNAHPTLLLDHVFHMPFDKATIEVKVKISFGSFDDILSAIKDVELSGAKKWATLVDKMGDLIAVAKAMSEVCHDLFSLDSFLIKNLLVDHWTSKDRLECHQSCTRCE
jgi:hypothetical protein